MHSQMNDPKMALINAQLAQRVGAGAGAMPVAQAVGAVWHEIELALYPIIGLGGVLALFQRSVHVAAAEHPWLLAGLGRDQLARFDATALTALLARQDAAQALACGNTLLRTLDALLTSLIGASLTERLLHPVWGPPPNNAPAQDMPR